MMTEAEKTVRITMTTGGIPAGRNPHPNSSVDPIFGCLCTARTWTLVFMSLKFVGLGLQLIMASLLSAGSEALRQQYSGSGMRIPPEIEEALEESDLVSIVYFWGALPFLIAYCLSLFGIIKEKLLLINFYIFWLGLEIMVILSLNVILVAHGKHMTSVVSSIFGAVFWGTLVILCALAFRKRVAFRKSQSLQSEPNTFYSV